MKLADYKRVQAVVSARLSKGRHKRTATETIDCPDCSGLGTNDDDTGPCEDCNGSTTIKILK